VGEKTRSNKKIFFRRFLKILNSSINIRTHRFACKMKERRIWVVLLTYSGTSRLYGSVRLSSPRVFQLSLQGGRGEFLSSGC
jgi:hypothetical protein